MPSLFLRTPTDPLNRSLAAAAPLNAGTKMPFQFQAKSYSSLDPISETEILAQELDRLFWQTVGTGPSISSPSIAEIRA